MTNQHNHTVSTRPYSFIGLLYAAFLVAVSAFLFAIFSSISVRAQACGGFEFNYCSDVAAYSPNSQDGQIRFTGPTPLQQNWLIQLKTLNNQPYPGSFTPQLIHQGVGGNCSQQLSTFRIGNLKPGTYKFIFSKTGTGCKDTVISTIHFNPCNFHPSLLSVSPVSSSIGQDGQAIFSATGQFGGTDALSLQYSLSKNGGPYVSAIGKEPRNNPGNPCVSLLSDSLPFFPSDGQLIICGLSVGTYKAALRTGYDATCADTIIFQIGLPVPDSVSRPVVSHASGTYSGNQTVTITASEGATIYYTLGGNVPNLVIPNSFTKLYTGPLTIYNTLTLRTIAVKQGVSSPVVARFYTINNAQVVSTPTLSLPSGSYSGLQNLEMSCFTPGATIYYTTNGMVPIPGSNVTKVYTGPVRLERTGTIRAMGVLSGYITSYVAVASYTISDVQMVDAPVFSTPPGIYVTPQSIGISCPTPGALILYTTNGMTPVPGLFAARMYSTPVNISTTTQLKARAFVAGFLESPVTVGLYTIGALRQNASTEETNQDPDLSTKGTNVAQLLSAYPNPNGGRFHLVIGENETEGTMKILNVLGREVWSSKTELNQTELEIDLISSPKGIYTIVFQSGTSKRDVRIIKE